MSKDEKNKAKQSIIFGVLSDENIQEETKNELIEMMLNNDRGVIKSFFSIIGVSTSLPKRLEEMVLGLI